MADFAKTIRITVDLLTKQATSGMKGFAQSVKSADGPLNKLKAGASGAGGALGAIPFAAVATGAAAAGVAVATFATKAVSGFAKMVLAADNFSKATGTSVEEASRLIAVADDFDISAGAVEKSLVRMGVVAGTNADKFAELGIEIARTADGGVDINGTFLNVMDTLANTTDASKRAAIGQQLLGRGFKELAPLIGKTEGELRAMLGTVEASQVVTEDNVGSAREWQAATDDLSDSIGAFSKNAGETLIPVLTDVVEIADGAVDVMADLAGAIRDADDANKEHTGGLGILGSALGNVGAAFQTATAGMKIWDKATGDAEDSAVSLEDAWRDTGLGAQHAATDTDVLAQAEEDQAAAADLAKASTDALKTAVDEQASSLKNMNEEMQVAIDLGHEMAGSQMEAEEASDEWAATLETLADDLQAAAEGSDTAAGAERAQRDVMRDALTKADGFATSMQRLSEKQHTAAGTALSAADAHRVWRHHMILAAAQADGPLRQSIINHIAAVEGIPPEKVTAILADINETTVAQAEGQINTASRDRAATIRVSADTAPAGWTIEAFRHEQANRFLRIPVGGRVIAMQTGGNVPSGGRTALVGEQGPELVDLPGGARVHTASATRRMAGTPGGAGPTVINQTINVRRAMTPREYRELARTDERRNGSITLA